MWWDHYSEHDSNAIKQKVVTNHKNNDCEVFYLKSEKVIRSRWRNDECFSLTLKLAQMETSLKISLFAMKMGRNSW